MTDETYRAIRELFPSSNPFSSLFFAEATALITRQERLDGHELAGKEAERNYDKKIQLIRNMMKEYRDAH